jgi:hypothetical protein
MKIIPIEVEFSYKYFTFRIFPELRVTELFGIFYNEGTIIITLFFKEFVLRWCQ